MFVLVWILLELKMIRKKDCEIKERIPVSFGAGIEWETSETKYMTVCHSFRDVSVHIDSWTPCGSLGATHWYARFEISSLDSVKLTGKDKGNISGIHCNELPEEAKGMTIEVTKLMEKDEFGNDPFTGKTRLNAKKGSRYKGFKDREEAVRFAKETFKRLFCDKGFCEWQLVNLGIEVDEDYNIKER